MVRSAALIIALATAVLSGPAAAAETFNLTCTGTQRTFAPILQQDETKPYTSTYRFDLVAKKWCESECVATFDLVEVTPTMLVLADKNIDTPRQSESMSDRISRQTGEHVASAISGIGRGRVAIFWRGTCEPSAFTGFPESKTKF